MKMFSFAGAFFAFAIIQGCVHNDFSSAPSITASKPEPVTCDATTLPGNICVISVEALRPSQFALGMRDVAGKRKKISKVKNSPERLANYLFTNAVPAVKGPGGLFYLTDGHHRSRALLEESVGKVYLRVTKDKSMATPTAFWNEMQAEKLIWLYDEHGQGPRRTEELPASLRDLPDDPYRSLAEDAMDTGCYKKTDTPFQQFMWANYFRPKIAQDVLIRDWQLALKLACDFSHHHAAKDLPGYFPNR